MRWTGQEFYVGVEPQSLVQWRESERTRGGRGRLAEHRVELWARRALLESHDRRERVTRALQIVLQQHTPREYCTGV